MGSDFSKHICCVPCGSCKKQELEEGNERTSESKPILQGKAALCAGLQPSSPALEAFQHGSEEVQALSQHWQPSAAAVEAEVETCAVDLLGATEALQAACDSTGFLGAPAEGDPKGEGEALTQAESQQEKVREPEEEIKLTPYASEAQPVQEEKPAAEQEQAELGEAGREAGTALQERNMLYLMEFSSETAAGQAFEIKFSGETLIGRNLLSSVQVSDESEIYFSAEQVEEMHWTEPAEVSPQPTESAEHAPLPALEPLQPAQKAGESVEASEVVADVTAEIYCPPTMCCESLEPANQLLIFLQQGTHSSVLTVQEMMESLRCGEPAEQSEASQQPNHEVLGELQERESRECGAEAAASEAEPQRWTAQQGKELPDQPTCAQVLAEEEAETLSEASRLSEDLGSSSGTD